MPGTLKLARALSAVKCIITNRSIWYPHQSYYNSIIKNDWPLQYQYNSAAKRLLNVLINLNNVIVI